ncbi:MAG: SGNH/GDSL hydrolase family protein [Lachnospiraceae bacterium]|nr:SGNH/GDSL hydrolase family protein [Lachnospiraceae bacterium]
MKYYSISEISKIHVFGRMGKQKDPLPLLFNGSGVEVVVTGSELWIDLETDSDFYEPWVAYELNGALMGRQMLLPGEHSLCLFRNMEPATPKRVRFYRELQAMSEDVTCKVLVKGLKINGEFLDVPKYERKLEFIGDSITSGEGTYGAYEDTDWLSMYMGASQNYATMTAKALGADYHLISQGGWGVYCGWDNDIRHNIPSVYEKVCGLAMGPMNEKMGTQEDYDFSQYAADAVIINLGTNDASAFNQPPILNPEDGLMYKQRINEDGTPNREDILKVEKAIRDFLLTVRKHNPKALIIWCYGMLGSDMLLPITEAINEYRNEHDDSKVLFLELPNTTEETFGSHMHPGPKAHEQASKVLVPFLKERLNW